MPTAPTHLPKQYIDPAQLLEDSFQLGAQILESGFRPGFIVGIWRGGTPVGIAVQEVLDYFGIETDHIAIRTSLYEGIGERRREIRIHGLQYVVDRVAADDGLLIVDDVFDTGRSIEAVIATLRERARRNTPTDIRIATAYYKPGNNETGHEPDYFVHTTENWLVFPHELCGLSVEEIKTYKVGLGALVERLG